MENKKEKTILERLKELEKRVEELEKEVESLKSNNPAIGITDH